MKQLRVLLTILICLSMGANAQTNSGATTASNQPIWVQMMSDENVNYFEAVEAFNSYFKTHPMPDLEVEEELMGGDLKAKEDYEKEMKRDNKSTLTEQERKSMVEREQMNYQVKRFRNWMKESKPFVQADGHILTSSERAAIWQKQQEEIKNNSFDKK